MSESDDDNVLNFEHPRVRAFKRDLTKRLTDEADRVAAELGVTREALLQGCVEFLEKSHNPKLPRRQ